MSNYPFQLPDNIENNFSQRTAGDTWYIAGKPVPGVAVISISSGRKVEQTKPRLGNYAQIRDLGKELATFKVQLYIYTKEDFDEFEQLLSTIDNLTKKQIRKVQTTATGSTTVNGVTVKSPVVKTQTVLQGYAMSHPALRNRSIDRGYIVSIDGPVYEKDNFATYTINCIEVRLPLPTTPKSVGKDLSINVDKVTESQKSVTTVRPTKPSEDPATTAAPKSKRK